ncbi:hypothetical protein CCACVL1_09229 [Corchorus capsularis]|uniref:SWIM-type domain-containing protein n=1 Tax=Corchorus capsularis TaxID=210143 RepID=A0A1R3IX41_COCAP|nr:hypothetical protein CCACVL1_09229 [Corchorus capsularis]
MRVAAAKLGSMRESKLRKRKQKAESRRKRRQPYERRNFVHRRKESFVQGNIVMEDEQGNIVIEEAEVNGMSPIELNSDNSNEVQLESAETERSIECGEAGTSVGGSENGLDKSDVDVYETTPEWEDVIGLNGFLIGKDPKKLSREDFENLQFKSSDEAYDFYRAYAHVIGFSARKGSSRVDKDSREVVMKEFSCNRAGARLAKWMKRCTDKRRQPKPLSRCNCPAHMRVTLDQNSGLWQVTLFKDGHNHKLAKESQKFMVRSNREVCSGAAEFARALKKGGSRPCEIMNYLAQEAGGYQNVGFTKKDLCNKLYRDSRNNVKELGDVKSALCYLEKRANRGGLCVGLQQFLRCMSDKRPISIVTDGAQAMANALKVVMLEANHRLCVWHIHRNAKRHLPTADAIDKFKRCMLAWWKADDFERGWKELVEMNGMRNNSWVVQMYRIKEYWAQAFITGKFFAGMKTSSRCEGYNSYLKRFIRREGTMVEFMQSIENAVKTMCEIETEEDYYSRQTKPLSMSEMKALEDYAGHVFTRKSFGRFRKELRREATYYSASAPAVMSTRIKVYRILKYLEPNNEREVSYDPENGSIKCDCMLLETDGIPCRHAIHVMKVENLRSIPKRCIKKRWTKNAKDLSDEEEAFASVDEKAIEALRRSSLQMMLSTICYMGSKSKKAFLEAREKISRLIESMGVESKNAKREDAPSTEDGPEGLTQEQAEPEGHPDQKKRREYKCSFCRKVGHKKPSCPMLEIRTAQPVELGMMRSSDSDSEYNTSDDELCRNGRSWADCRDYMDEEAVLSDPEEEVEGSRSPSDTDNSVAQGVAEADHSLHAAATVRVQ